MANWYGTARSNYFKVKDMAAFNEWVASFDDLKVVTRTLEKDSKEVALGRYQVGEVLVMIHPSEFSDSGAWPSYRTDAEGEEIDIELTEELVEHLSEGEVAIMMEVGAEKLRYLTGYAQAVAWNGKVITLSIDDIYEQALQAFSVQPTRAEY